LTESETCSQNQ